MKGRLDDTASNVWKITRQIVIPFGHCFHSESLATRPEFFLHGGMANVSCSVFSRNRMRKRVYYLKDYVFTVWSVLCFLR